jgi:hypothetical protein
MLSYQVPIPSILQEEDAEFYFFRLIINVSSGTYTVHKTITQITGAGASNTITFQSSLSDSTQVTLNYTYTSTAAENYIIKLAGTDYVTFKSMTFYALLGDLNNGTVFQ